jgi:quercetin dioxygenase-like cupin family protein
MRSTKLVLQLFAAMLVFAIAAGQDLNAKASEPQVTTLLETDVAGAEGKEWSVITVELTPGAMDTRHFHPGVELVYVLEGAGFLEVDGKAPVALNPGTVAALHPKHSHVLKNTSQTQTLKIVVVLLLDKGQQHPMLAKRGTPPKAAEQKNGTRPGLVF